jgi:uncharacterized damage-inducible protein DinB
MTISLERALRHMAWANQKVYEAVETLPDESLQGYVVNKEWTTYEIVFHICQSAGFYVWRLGIGDKPADIEEPAKVVTLRKLLETHDKNLLLAAAQDDREIEFKREDKVIHRWASTILTQAVHHATEHRAQLIDTLEYKGFKPINLDDIDLWAFDEYEKGNH